MTTTDTKGREFEITAQVAELLDTLSDDQKKQAMAMLAVRYGLQIKEPIPQPGGGYRPKPRRGY